VYFSQVEIIKSPLKAIEMPLVKVPLWKDTGKHKSFPSALEIGSYCQKLQGFSTGKRTLNGWKGFSQAFAP